MRQIADWLREIGLEQYAQRFAENDIDFSILNELTDQDLEKIGIISLGHRRKLLRAIAALENPQNDKPSLATSSPDTPGEHDNLMALRGRSGPGVLM